MKQKEFKSQIGNIINSAQAADDAPEAETKKLGYILSPEKKSKHINALVQPSVWEAVKKYAESKKISANEVVNQALREYLEKNATI